jgi:hypothetical protein
MVDFVNRAATGRALGLPNAVYGTDERFAEIALAEGFN